MFDLVVWSEEDSNNDVESLFDVFVKYYALKELKIFFKNNTDILIEKYNVIGKEMDSVIFNVYEDASVDVKLGSFDFNMVKSVYV